jgi:hypothetical protein
LIQSAADVYFTLKEMTGLQFESGYLVEFEKDDRCAAGSADVPSASACDE